MFSRASVAAIALAVLPLSASAQVESEGMSDITAWGARYLEADEGEFPARLWQGSSDEALLALMQQVNTTRITPTERALLRRAVLSSTRKPTGDKADALLAERAKLMLALGEAEAAAALAPRLETDLRGIDAETLAVDLALARGDEATACSRANSGAALPEGLYWLKLRAVCAVLQENYSGAELAVEVASAQGLNDPWFVSAIFAAAGDVHNPPNARFDTGLNIALSAKADLDQSRITTSSSRPDLAAAAARRRGVPPELAERFATLAAEAALLSPQEQRRILMARMQEDAYTAQNSVQSAIQTFRDPAATLGDKARRVDIALRSSGRGDITRITATAQLLLPELQSLPRSRETADYALTFAKAALTAGDNRLAQSWLAATEFEGMRPADPFEIARLEAVDLMTGGDKSRASQASIQARLINAAKESTQKADAAALLTLWQGFDLNLGPEARSLIAAQTMGGKRLAPGDLTALEASARAGAIGETILRTLALTDRAPQQIAARDMAVVIKALRQVGAEDAARGFAREAAGLWDD